MNFHTRKWVKPEDLNPNGTLFGGSLLRWIDEEAAIYAIVQLGNQRVVTKYISEINFVSASRQGDIIELGITATEFGRTSITLTCEVRNKITRKSILTVEKMVFVNLGEDGKPKAVDGAVVGFFSLEMSSEQLATRMLAEQAEVPSEKIRKGELISGDFDKVLSVSQELEHLNFFIDDTPALSIAALRTRARRLKRTHGLGLLVVDYLQLLNPSGRSRQENRVQEVSEITRGLKTLAKELDVPVLALSQLSRAVEQREDKRPQLSDLRESGSIEQDADVVMFVYREEYYLERGSDADRARIAGGSRQGGEDGRIHPDSGAVDPSGDVIADLLHGMDDAACKLALVGGTAVGVIGRRRLLQAAERGPIAVR